MAIFRAAGSKKSPAFSVALSLIASLLVLVGPFSDRSDAYTDFTNFTTAGAITYNDKICNLGDPALRQSSATAFEISTSDQLWEVTDCVSTSATIYFKLGDNINVSEAVAAPTASPIGYSTSNGIAHSFSGVLDGQNKVISGISMSTTSFGVGLFAHLENATVSNLVIEGSFVTTEGEDRPRHSSGALAIQSEGNLFVSSVSNKANVSGMSRVGGLIGSANDSLTIHSSSNTGLVTGTNNLVGGLAGQVNNANIHSSHNTGPVTGRYDVGGLIGSAYDSLTIHSSSNTGLVTGTNNRVGGLAGAVQNANIHSSHNTGPVTGARDDVGGLVGRVWDDVRIASSHNTVSVTGEREDVGGLIGEANTANISSSHNTGPVSGSRRVGGLIGFASDVTISSSLNSGRVSGSNIVGGLIGFAPAATVTSSMNTAPVSAVVRFVGGLVGDATDVTISSSLNSGRISGSDLVGGLIGFVGSAISIDASFNIGPISGYETVGGLVGGAAGASISNTYNTGAVSGTDEVGGLMGAANIVLAIHASYNTGTVVGQTNFDGLLGYISGVATVSALYSSQATIHGTVSARSTMKVASTFVGFDFANTWGFGRTNDNQGFPILRVFGQASQYFSDFPRPASSNSALAGLAISEGSLNPVFSQLNMAYSATVSNSITSIRVTPTKADAEAVIAVNGTAVPSGVASSAIALSVGNNTINIVVTAADLTTTTYALVVNRAGSGSVAPDPVSSAPQAANYAGPMITLPRTATQGSEVVFTGTRLGSVARVFAGSVELSVSALANESKTLKLPTTLRPGTYDLIVLSSFGTLTVISGLTVLDPTVPAPEPEAPKKVLSVGTFRGYIAIYTKGYEGSKLSAKVAGKWLVVPSLKESWKSRDYSRAVRFTGVGYSIKVDLYVDGVFMKTVRIVTS